MLLIQKDIRQYFTLYGLSHSFICTAVGGAFLVISGVYIDPNLGRITTGCLLTLRGVLSESSRAYLLERNFSDATSGLPGMVLAASMNWPAFLSAESIGERIAFGLAGAAMTLKLFQYLPYAISDIFNQSKQEKFIFLLSKIIHTANQKIFNSINKNLIFLMPAGIGLYFFDSYQRHDYAGILACIFILIGGLLLAVKTRIELASQ